MKVYEEMNNVFQVDLCQVADNDVCNDVPVSVRDALVFLEFGVFPGGYVKPARKSLEKENNFMPPEMLRVSSKISAIVSHVNDPSFFYIQQMSTASYLANLIYEMGETYNDKDVFNHHEIYAPRIGMACAAQFTVDKQWYRARVLSLPGKGKVEVQYVDFGNKEVIDHSSLRKLFNKFFKLNVQAIPCKLANVTYSTKCWSDEAKKWLTNAVSRKQLTLQCTGIIPGEKKAEVILYYNDEEFDYCVNALMVEERLASSTRAFSNPSKVKRKKPTPVKNSNPPAQPVKTPPKASSSHFNNASSSSSSNASDCNSSSALPAPKKYEVERNHTAASSSKKSVASSPSQNAAVAGPSKKTSKFCDVNSTDPSLKGSPKKKYPSLATPSEAEDYIEVHVSHIVSPGLFYFRIAGTTEEKFKILMCDLQNAYQNRKSAIADCCVGKAYAVYSAIQKKWLRGAVVTELPDDSIKIHYIDFGSTEVVEKKFIQELDGKFTLDDAFSVQGHLDGIMPAGGVSEWAGSACDLFHRLAEAKDTLLLSTKGEFDKEKKSLPSDLLIENLIVGGALEPTKIEHKSITTELIKMGLVLPMRRSRCGSPLSSSSKAPEQEVSLACLLTSPKEETLPKCIMLPFYDTVQAEIPPPVEPTFQQEPAVPPVTEILPPSEPTFQWKPSVPPMEAKFKGYVTNISEDGNVQLYPVHQGSGQVETISQALQFRYNREEDNPLKSLPPLGEACVAKFSLDQKWYRAEVIDVYPDSMQVKVNFVDYGNNEIVPLSAVRTDIIMKPFPRLCLECSLHGINMRNNDQEFLTFLHSQLVETIVSVEIMDGKNAQGCLPCAITTVSGINIAELMLSMGFEDSAEDSDALPTAAHEEALSFARAQVLKQEKIYPICIIEMTQDNVYLQILEFPEPQDSDEQQQNETLIAFENLIKELKKDAESFPVLKNPKPGMPCCAKYSYDEEWYRCEVVNLTENDAVVLFVDYGNIEKVKKDDLRELKSHFIEFPIQLYICKLFGLKPIGSDWDPEVKKQLMLSGKKLYAQVMSPGEISHVDLLLKKEDKTYDSAYQDLITNCLIVTNKPDSTGS